ncbi:MAG TPA: deaminase domain-containing protein, partial [Kiritimatiellia bacterium]|nr:deaminase domain-containing protein [Kiritimatiellia bacterium]
FFRNADTERKIIEDIAKRLGDPAAAGDIRLYTDLYPCASCRHVMRQFLAAYTNVRIQVLFRER